LAALENIPFSHIEHFGTLEHCQNNIMFLVVHFLYSCLPPDQEMAVKGEKDISHTAESV